MSMKVVVAVGNKEIERLINQMETVDVLTTIRRRETVLDAVADYNPHAIILSRDLGGRADLMDIIQRCRQMKDKCRIVIIYGEEDEELRYFADFLVRQGVYNMLVGEVTEDSLIDAIEREYTLDDVSGYQLNRDEVMNDLFAPVRREAPEPVVVPVPDANKEIETHKMPAKIANAYRQAVQAEIERETNQSKVLGNVNIAIASLRPRGGSTHTALELAAALHRLKKDVGVILDDGTYDRLRTFYVLPEEDDSINLDGIALYKDEILAMNRHKAVIRDMGCLTADKQYTFFSANSKLLLCGVAAWEIDDVTGFLRTNKHADTVDYLLWPVTDAQAVMYAKKLRRSGCRARGIAFNPDPLIKNAENAKMFQQLLLPLIGTI